MEESVCSPCCFRNTIAAMSLSGQNANPVSCPATRTATAVMDSPAFVPAKDAVESLIRQFVSPLLPRLKSSRPPPTVEEQKKVGKQGRDGSWGRGFTKPVACAGFRCSASGDKFSLGKNNETDGCVATGSLKWDYNREVEEGFVLKYNANKL